MREWMLFQSINDKCYPLIYKVPGFSKVIPETSRAHRI